MYAGIDSSKWEGLFSPICLPDDEKIISFNTKFICRSTDIMFNAAIAFDKNWFQFLHQQCRESCPLLVDSGMLKPEN